MCGFSPPFGAVAVTCWNAVLTCRYVVHAHCTSFRNFPHLYARFWTYVRQICVKSSTRKNCDNRVDMQTGCALP